MYFLGRLFKKYYFTVHEGATLKSSSLTSLQFCIGYFLLLSFVIKQRITSFLNFIRVSWASDPRSFCE